MRAVDRSRAAAHRALRGAAQRVDASRGLRALVALGACILSPALVAAVREGAVAAEAAARFGVGFATAWWLGRALRLRGERTLGASDFAASRSPAFDAITGTLAQACALLAISAVWKRGLGLAVPLGGAIGRADASALALPLLALAVAAVLSLGARARAVVPRRSESGAAAAFLAVFAWVAGAHWRALAPYSSDPAQHIAWLAQVELAGFAPDVYWQTTAPITYPLGFHALLVAIGGVARLLPATCVALAPPLASTALVYLAVEGARAVVPRANGRTATAWLSFALFAAGALALSSAQLSSWNAYEGTGRLSAGLLHAVPFAVLLATARGARAVAPPLRARFAGFGGVFGCFASGALVVLVNPTHAILHASLSSVALVRGLATRSIAPLGLASGLAAGAALALTMAAGDAASSRALGLIPAVDAATARVESEFDAEMRGASCLRPRCIAAAALRADTWVDAAMPVRVMIEGPLRALLEPALDLRRTIPIAIGPRTFPDPTGRGIGPIQGWVRWLLIPVPLALWWRRRDRAFLWTAGALVAAAVLDAALRSVLRALVHADDPALRLWPDYANRAAAIAFSQMLWPLLAAGAVLGATLFADGERSARERAEPGRVLRLALVGLALALALATADRDVRARQREVAHATRGPARAELAALRALEARSIPDGEAYLVSAQVVRSNRERWVVPTDASLPLYLQAARPSLFLYQLSLGARSAASDLGAMCEELALPTAQPPALLERARARWVALIASSRGDAERAFGARAYCGLPAERAFPAARLVDVEGRIALFRLF